MNWERYLLSALLILDLIVGYNANLSNAVHRGLALKSAYEKAKTLCPEKLQSSQIKKIKNKISALLSPSTVARDPNRNTYISSYVESPEVVNNDLLKICQPGVFVDPATFEQPDTETSDEETGMADEETVDEEIAILQKEKETRNSVNLNGYVLFIFGFVSGMLLIFIYFSQKYQPTVKNVSLRRPEL